MFYFQSPTLTSKHVSRPQILFPSSIQKHWLWSLKPSTVWNSNGWRIALYKPVGSLKCLFNALFHVPSVRNGHKIVCCFFMMGELWVASGHTSLLQEAWPVLRSVSKWLVNSKHCFSTELLVLLKNKPLPGGFIFNFMEYTPLMLIVLLYW